MSPQLHSRRIKIGLGLLALGAAVSAVGQSPAAAVAAKDAPKAAQAYLAGIRLVDKNDLAGAQTEFARAATLDPTRAEYETALALTRDHRIGELIQQAAKERLTSHAGRADQLFAEAAALDPNNELVQQHLNAGIASGVEPARTRIVTTPAKSYLPPIQLEPTAGLQDVHVRGDARQVVTRAALLYGIHTVYDDSVNGQGAGDLRFDLEQTPYTQAMPILLRMAHLFAVPIDTKTIMVVKDTEENHTKFERQVEETVYIPASTTEQINELVNIVKNVFDVKQVALQAGSGTLAIRAPAPTLKAVNYTLADMLDGGSEVMLEIKLVSVNRDISREIGFTPPNTASAFSVAQELESVYTTNLSLINTLVSSGAITIPSNVTGSAIPLYEAAFLVLSGAVADAKLTNILTLFGNGLTLFGLSISNGANFNLALNSSEAHALDDITIRMGDRQTSTLRVGEKYPITTATYGSGVSSSTASALAGATINGVSVSKLLSQYSTAATVPQVQFEDLGLTLKTTPTVMRSNLVHLNIDLKLEALTGNSLDNIPILTSSVFTSDLTVPDGDTVVMMSETSKTESASITGLPGLAELPGFDSTLSDKLKETASSELIIMVTPHIVRHRKNSLASLRIPFVTSVPVDY